MGTITITATGFKIKGNLTLGNKTIDTLPLILGNDEDEVLVTTDAADRLDARGGNDSISTFGGDDKISGGAGNDTIDGGDGNDLVFGYVGNDMINGEEGNDVLIGANPVFNFGKDEKDTFNGGLGEDVFVLGDSQHIYYDDGDSTSIGESDYALIQDLNVGEDYIQLYGSGEFYSLDFYTSASGDIQADLIYDPGVAARAELIAILEDVSADLQVTDFLLPDDRLNDPSFIGGTNYDDIYTNTFNGGSIFITTTSITLIPYTLPNFINGTSENDVLTGTENQDIIYGVGGNDNILGNEGNDRIYGGQGNDAIAGNEGNDSIYGGLGNDDIKGGRGDDSIHGGDGEDTIAGGNGNDTIAGGQGKDRIFGGNGNDTIAGGQGDDRIFGGNGNDTIAGGQGDDTLIGVNGASGLGVFEQDVLTGNSGKDLFVLGDSDRIYYRDDDPLTRGENDYARITDFNSLDDSIQLHGSVDLYNLDLYTTGSGTVNAAITYDPGVSERRELIGIIESVSPTLSLRDPAFIFV